PQFTDLIWKNDLGTATHMMIAYAANISWPFENVVGRDSEPALTNYAKTWDSNNDASYSFPNGVTLTPDEIAVYSDFYPDIKTYVEEMTVQFIMGLTPVSEYDAFVETLKGLGIEDLIAAYQTAYDRYINR
ncbi:MAG: hypothetical protein LBM74_04775, partial [Oscillospiraceae bacterium]|nr:hypothetical protein [Oscillospiraceae bacterium]